ncbi:MAG TPA: phosphotransferase [Pyrinomonadaceae bacterium]|nr:phosphotransferase [Pyrinomonadaceae bacterium]
MHSFDVEAAVAIAEKHFGISGTAQPLPSERDQNFLLTNHDGAKFVLKIANAQEDPGFLDAQNLVMKHVAARGIWFCQQLVPASSGEEMVGIDEHLVRVVTYLDGVSLAEIESQPSDLLRDLGKKLGQLDRAMIDFDHPAVHRVFHWDLASGNRVIDDYAQLIEDPQLRELVYKCRFEPRTELRRSVIHGDANDRNVLVHPERMIVGIIDFGDMVYSYTAGNLAIGIAYAVLGKADPAAAAREVIDGYMSEFPLLDNEIEALWSLVLLRLGMSASLAAYQGKQRPENEYLQVTQPAIRENLGRLLAADLRG